MAYLNREFTAMPPRIPSDQRGVYGDPRGDFEQVRGALAGFLGSSDEPSVTDKKARETYRTAEGLGLASNLIPGKSVGALGMMAFGNRISKDLNKALALKMFKQGAGNNEILKETGLLVPMSGTRHIAEPLPTTSIKSTEQALQELGMTQRYADGYPVATHLEQLIDNPEYFKRYPEMRRNLPVVMGDRSAIRPPYDGSYRGIFVNGAGVGKIPHVFMNVKNESRTPLSKTPWENANRTPISELGLPKSYSTLEHEALHPTQEIANFHESLQAVPWENRIHEIMSSVGGMDTPENMASSLDEIKHVLGRYYPSPDNTLVKFRTSTPSRPALNLIKSNYSFAPDRINRSDLETLKQIYGWE